MKKITITVFAGLTLASNTAQAQWGMNPFSGNNMMPSWGGQTVQPRYVQPQYSQPSFGNMMPWGRATTYQAPVYQAPQNSFSQMMPWGGTTQTPVYQQPQTNGFSNMMPWGSMTQPQYQYPQPQTQGFMMPGMDQGIRSMMQPGKIMAEEATPGMYMKPTWR